MPTMSKVITVATSTAATFSGLCLVLYGMSGMGVFSEKEVRHTTEEYVTDLTAALVGLMLFPYGVYDLSSKCYADTSLFNGEEESDSDDDELVFEFTVNPLSTHFQLDG